MAQQLKVDFGGAVWAWQCPMGRTAERWSGRRGGGYPKFQKMLVTL